MIPILKMQISLPNRVKNFSANFLNHRFFERDWDITYYDELHYIFITLNELVRVIRTGNK